MWLLCLPALAREPVVVARRELHVGEVIALEALALEDSPLGSFGDRPFIDPEELVDRTARERILAGEVIRRTRLVDSNQAPGLAGLIPKGQRGIVLPTIPGPIVQPGDRVDLLRTRNGATRLLIEAAPVLEVRPDAIAVVVPAARMPELLGHPEELDLTVRNPASTVGEPDRRASTAPPPADLGTIAGEGPQIWVAATDLAAGREIGAAQLVRVPLPAATDRVSDTWLDADRAVGRVPVDRILAGEPILEERLDQRAEPRSAAIPPGLRALTLDRRPPEATVLIDGARVTVVVSPEQAIELVRRSRAAR